MGPYQGILLFLIVTMSEMSEMNNLFGKLFHKIIFKLVVWTLYALHTSLEMFPMVNPIQEKQRCLELKHQFFNIEVSLHSY